MFTDIFVKKICCLKTRHVCSCNVVVVCKRAVDGFKTAEGGVVFYLLLFPSNFTYQKIEISLLATFSESIFNCLLAGFLEIACLYVFVNTD